MARLLSIGTALPKGLVQQEDACAQASFYNCASAREERVLQKLYQRTLIETRPTIFRASNNTAELTEKSAGALSSFYPLPRTAGNGTALCQEPGAGDSGSGQPGTAARMARYREEIAPLAEAAAKEALTKIELSADCIENLVTVSCTGFFAPGLDTQLIENLGLSRNISRTNVGFMGCHGAMNGLRVASAMARVEQSISLVVAAELCSLHFQYGHKSDDLIANALFADGAAAAVLSGRSDHTNLSKTCTLKASTSYLLPDSRDAMTWQIGDHGFHMTLSPEVPSLIEQNLAPFLKNWLTSFDLDLTDVGSFAVHPGGPRVLDAVQHALHLAPDALAHSRDIFIACGNMSSPTILFILERLLTQNAAFPIVALAFGPGLTIEAALFS
jgi:predicted naringenin-chalcone synthase